jgi:lysophospholipase L1-like esterase
MTYNRIIIWAYIILLHIIVGYLLYNPFAIINQYWRFDLGHIKNNYIIEQMYQYHHAVDNVVDNVPVLLLGDSHLHRMDTGLIHKKLLNFAVGGDTIHHISTVINQFKSVKKADTIIILGGVNDLIHRNYPDVIDDYQRLLQKIPNTTKKFIITIPPVAKNFKQGLNEQIMLLNTALTTTCKTHNNCTVIDLHSALTKNEPKSLTSYYNYGDNIHLNKNAYKVLADLINNHI